ncbi:hypothetical protein P261_01438 [Lachnospiraceae bacterium TWA4]|nr:hypothetical protein P261_01438 [Lachnospiraceae bacterium TWA4]
MAACAVLTIGLIIGNPLKETQEVIEKPTEFHFEKNQENKVGDILELSGTLKEVTRAKLDYYINYQDLSFLNMYEKKKYFLSYLDSGKISYGAIDIELSKDYIVRIFITPKLLVDLTNVYLEETLEEGDYSLELYKNKNSDTFYATTKDSFFYTITTNKMSKNQFIELTQRVFNPLNFEIPKLEQVLTDYFKELQTRKFTKKNSTVNEYLIGKLLERKKDYYDRTHGGVLEAKINELQIFSATQKGDTIKVKGSIDYNLRFKRIVSEAYVQESVGISWILTKSNGSYIVKDLDVDINKFYLAKDEVKAYVRLGRAKNEYEAIDLYFMREK